MKKSKQNEKRQLIASIFFWIFVLIWAVSEYETISFRFNTLVMTVFFAVSAVTAMQWLFCYHLPAGAAKLRKQNYQAAKFNEVNLKKDIKNQNKSAIMILVIWILFLIFEGIFIHYEIVDEKLIILGMIILRIMDRAFILIWCPFGAIMGNKCCNGCRIYGWDQLMLNSPMVFYINLYTLILIVLSVIPFIEWEIAVKRHPEWFSELSNKAIRCSKNCSTWCGRCKIK